MALLLAGAGPTGAQQAAEIVPAPTTTAEQLAMLVALGDAQDRMTVPVSISGSGPYDFIIDTGAERTVISRQLASTLGLESGPDVLVTALTGQSMADTVIVPSLNIDTLQHNGVTAPALEGFYLGAPGMLGLDALQDRSVTIDFDRNRMAVTHAKKGGFAGGFDDIVVTAKSLYGQLIVTNARYHHERISVVIDTGSPITIGNSALRAIMTRQPRSLGHVSLVSATGGHLNAQYSAVDQIEIGGVRFRNVGVAFADAAPFARFGLTDTPALLLGMDTLRLFRRVKIDFKHRVIYFDLPRKRTFGSW